LVSFPTCFGRCLQRICNLSHAPCAVSQPDGTVCISALFLLVIRLIVVDPTSAPCGQKRRHGYRHLFGIWLEVHAKIFVDCMPYSKCAFITENTVFWISAIWSGSGLHTSEKVRLYRRLRTTLADKTFAGRFHVCAALIDLDSQENRAHMSMKLR